MSAGAFVILMALPKDRWPGARYGVLFAIAGGLYPSLCGVVTWNANNLAGSWKRAIGMALQITIGNLGGAVGSNIYLKRETPHYWTGYGVSLAVLIAAIISGFVLRFSLKKINAKRDRLTAEAIWAMYSAEQLAEVGDQSPFFRYTL